MRIMIVSDAWEPQVNGVVRTLKMTSRELEKLGHVAEILGPDRFRSMPCPSYPEIHLALASRAAVAREIDRFGPDALHVATEGPLGWKARSIALARGWPFTTAFHTRFPEYVHARTRIPVAWTHSIIRRFHAPSSAVLTPTQKIIDDLVAFGYRNLRLWSRGVDLEVFRPDGPRIESDRPVFTYVGRVAVEKNLEAFLKLDLPGVKWMAGVGPAREALQRRHPEVRWFGNLQARELADVYRSSDVFVFPSLTDTFGLVLLEAMACGTPVAAFPVAGPLDVLGDGGGGVMDADLRVACLRALEVPREKARAHAETFSWAACTRTFAEALRQIPQRGRAPVGVEAAERG